MYPLIIMTVLALFNQFYYYSEMSYSSSGGYSFSDTSIPLTGENQSVTASGEIIENGTSTSIQVGNAEMAFDLNTTGYFIALIIGVGILAGVLGINFLGSGLSERAQRIIFNSIICYGFWGIFSALILTLLMAIPVFGLILWVVMTMVYTFGFFKRIEGN